MSGSSRKLPPRSAKFSDRGLSHLSSFREKCDETETIAALVRKLKPEGSLKLLDIGSGPGLLVKNLRKDFAKIYSIEPEPSFHAILKAKSDVLYTSQWEVVEIEELFDFIVVSHVLEYITHSMWLQCLRKAHQWLSPGGTMLVVQNHPNSTFMRLMDAVNQGSYSYVPSGIRHKMFVDITHEVDSNCQIKTIVSRATFANFSEFSTACLFHLEIDSCDLALKEDLLRLAFKSDITFELAAAIFVKPLTRDY